MKQVFAGREEIKLDHARAWSLWPGVIEARDVRLRMQDHNVEWVLEIPRARLTMSLHELAHQTVHLTRARDLADREGLPACSALRRPAGRTRVRQRPAHPRSRVPTLHAEDVDVGAAEAWVHELRYDVRGPLLHADRS